MNIYYRQELPYKLNDLEPIISSQTMYYHYEVLHKNYEIKLLETIEGKGLEFSSLAELMTNLNKLPAALKEDVRFFGGGLINHNFFFAHLARFEPQPKKTEPGKKITPALLNLIQKYFVSWENLKKELVKNALKIRGSGWTWLVVDKNKQLSIVNTANQDGPWPLNLFPLIAIDVWEHAYFLDYGTNRQEYVEKLLNNLLNWEYINQIYTEKFGRE